MDDKERNRRFLRERQRQARQADKIPDAVIRDLIQLLKTALANIRATLGAQPTEWQTFHLNQVKASVKSALDDFTRYGDAALSQGAAKAWHAGQAAIDLPLAAGGVTVRDILPALNTRQLVATQTFLTSKITDISGQALRRVNSELGLVLIGVQSPSEATTKLSRILDIARNRAITITRTELGRVYEAAAHERRLQAKETLPGLKKQWRRSGKLHSRLAHDAVDGQIRNADEPFNVGGEKLQYPRDPNGSAKNTINCGCTSLPYMDSWDVQRSGKQPFTPQEIARNPLRRDLPISG